MAKKLTIQKIIHILFVATALQIVPINFGMFVALAGDGDSPAADFATVSEAEINQLKGYSIAQLVEIFKGATTSNEIEKYKHYLSSDVRKASFETWLKIETEYRKKAVEILAEKLVDDRDFEKFFEFAGKMSREDYFDFEDERLLDLSPGEVPPSFLSHFLKVYVQKIVDLPKNEQDHAWKFSIDKLYRRSSSGFQNDYGQALDNLMGEITERRPGLKGYALGIVRQSFGLGNQYSDENFKFLEDSWGKNPTSLAMFLIFDGQPHSLPLDRKTTEDLFNEIVHQAKPNSLKTLVINYCRWKRSDPFFQDILIDELAGKFPGGRTFPFRVDDQRDITNLAVIKFYERNREGSGLNDQLSRLGAIYLDTTLMAGPRTLAGEALKALPQETLEEAEDFRLAVVALPKDDPVRPMFKHLIPAGQRCVEWVRSLFSDPAGGTLSRD